MDSLVEASASALKMEAARFFEKLASTNSPHGDLTQEDNFRNVTAMEILSLTKRPLASDHFEK
jgi:hypothetical protein